MLDLIASGHFSRGDREMFLPLLDNLLRSRSVPACSPTSPPTSHCQERVSDAWREHDRWTRMSILNSARTGKFSSDRAIREYASGSGACLLHALRSAEWPMVVNGTG